MNSTVDNAHKLHWHKSSHSNNGGSCVEIAPFGTARAARDSKDPDGPVLPFALVTWKEFLNDIKAGKYHLP